MYRTLIMSFFFYKETTVHEDPGANKGRYEAVSFISFPLTCYPYVVIPDGNLRANVFYKTCVNQIRDTFMFRRRYEPFSFLLFCAKHF